METIEGLVTTLRGKEPGPHIVISGSVHGNETCGPDAFEEILPTLSLARGSATFVISNPKARERRVRFTEANLNRLFKSDEFISPEQKSTYEYKRSRELMPLFLEADALLDIHSGATPGMEPFAICNPLSGAVARTLGFPIVSWGWDVLEPGGTDDYMYLNGKIGVCVECGYHTDSESIEYAKRAIYNFLGSMGLIDFTPERMSSRYIKTTHVHVAQVDFRPARSFKDFDFVKKEELIGIDGKTSVFAPYDCLVLFVRSRDEAGHEAFLVAKEVSEMEF